MAVVPDSTDGKMVFEMELFQVSGNEVSHFDMLQVLPQPFDRIQVWCIAWQSFENTGRTGVTPLGAYVLTIHGSR